MFVIIFLIGFFAVTSISLKFTYLERIALGFPVGFGITSFVMFALCQVGVGIHVSSLQLILFVCMALLIAISLLHTWKTKSFPWQQPRPKPDFSGLTLVWLVFAAMIGYLVWGISSKCLYWPPAEFDTILGYDLLSKAIAREGTLANSILTNKAIVEGCGPRLLYPPLLAFCNSLCYLKGMDTPKIINTLLYLSWVPLFYLLLRRLVNATNAIVFTLLTVAIPEMFAHASFSLTNLPCAIYACSAVFAFVIWYEKKLEHFFYLSVLLMCFAIWTRSDVVMFIAATLAFLAWYTFRTKTSKHLLMYLLPLVPFLVD